MRMTDHAGDDRPPTLQEAAAAARVLLCCNGHDLSQWTDDDWPDEVVTNGLRAIIRRATSPAE